MKKKIAIIIGAFILIVIGILIGLCLYGLTPVSNSTKVVEFDVPLGTSKFEIIDELKDKGLIKSKIALYFYLLTNKGFNLQAGLYEFSPSMSAKEILEKLNNGEIKVDDNTFSLTFIEGKRITDYVKVIAGATDISEEDVISILNDTDYIKELIDEYWFLTDEILQSGIYYPLEGYLFPSTYNLYNGSSVKDIVAKLLNGMDAILTNFKDQIDASSYSVHEILTMASIVESEGANADDRAGVAGVFYNRLNNGEPLGSDVTAYYAAKKNFTSDLYLDEINACNPYNTRGTCAVSGIPIGPVSNPSLESINAAINPSNHDYYFFVADKNKKTYFTKTYSEHVAKTDELKSNGLWYIYE